MAGQTCFARPLQAGSLPTRVTVSSRMRPMRSLLGRGNAAFSRTGSRWRHSSPTDGPLGVAGGEHEDVGQLFAGVVCMLLSLAI